MDGKQAFIVVVLLVCVGGLFFAYTSFVKGSAKQPPNAQANLNKTINGGLEKVADGVPPAAPRSGVFGWRGDGCGCFPDADPPLTWGHSEEPKGAQPIKDVKPPAESDYQKNLKWSAKTGTTGYASPVIMNGKIFVVSEPDSGGTHDELYAVDLADGKALWKKTISADKLGDEIKGKLPERGSTGTAAATPVAHAGCVYVALGNGLVACFREDGTEVWTVFLDQPTVLEYGRSASPLLADGKLLVMGAHLTALNLANGQVLWEAKEVACSYGSPALAKIGGEEVVITPRGDVVGVRDGKVLLKEIGQTAHTTPLVHEDIVYFIDQGCSAVRLPKKIETPLEAKRLWVGSVEGETFASPVLHANRLYTIDSHGIYRVLDAGTGKILLEKDSGLKPAEGEVNLYPSVTLAGKYLFLSNDRGQTLLLEPGDEYKEVRRNHLESGAGGSLLFLGKHLFVRGERRLFCVGP